MDELQTYIACGVWKSFRNEWRFIVNKEKCGRSLTLESTTTFEMLKEVVSEDYGIDQGMVDVEISYLPSELIGKLEYAPIIVTNNRQVRNLIGYIRKESMIQLCLTFKSRGGEDQRSRLNIDLNKEPEDSTDGEETHHEHVFESNDNTAEVSEGCVNKVKLKNGFRNGYYDSEVCGVDDLMPGTVADSGMKDFRVVDCLKEQQHFKSKKDLKAAMEICAMKYNFDYMVTKSDTKLWCIRCKDNICNWRVRAEYLEGSTYLKINKNVAQHTCAPSKKRKFCRTASAKTIGHLIMHKYEGVKEGPKPNDIINIIRTEHGSELSYSKAWEARECAVSIVRGIQEKSFSRIPKYLHMLKEINPGTYTNYEYDGDGRFKYLFLSFGQCVRGFYKAIRRVIVVDGAFLKNKYKGVILVATAVDGNSNLYPISFGIVDSENDRSWEWFFIQLKVVIADEQGLAFVSDRQASIGKTLGKVYPLARHGICIHHLLNNVVTYFKAKGLARLVAKASKA